MNLKTNIRINPRSISMLRSRPTINGESLRKFVSSKFMRAKFKRIIALITLNVNSTHFPIWSNPTGNWKFFAHKMNWVIAIIICVTKAVNPAPIAPYLGIRNMFTLTLMITPMAEMIFNSFKFPFAVNNVPKTKFMAIPMKLSINHMNGSSALASEV